MRARNGVAAFAAPGIPASMLAAILAAMLAGCGPVDGPGGAGGPSPGEVVERDTVDVLTLNIWHNQQDWPARLEELVRGVRAADPDVICLQEVLEEPGLPNQARTLAERLGYDAVHFASWDSVGSPKRYGNAILSRAPIVHRDHRLLDPPDDYRVALHARVVPGRDTLDVYCTHLHHTAEGAETRRTQVLDVLDFIDLTRGNGPVLLAGDFNAPVTAPELEPVLDRFGDAWGAVHGDTAAAVTTLNTGKGHRFERIDHIFFRSGLHNDMVPRSARIVLDEPGATGVWPSDHFGLLARFVTLEPRLPFRGDAGLGRRRPGN